MKENGITGKGGLALALLVWAVMAAWAFIMRRPLLNTADTGICFPSPATWSLLPGWSFAINCGAVVLAALGLVILNRRYNFIPSTTLLFASVFLIAAGACPWVMIRFSASTLLLGANFLGLCILLANYGRRQATTGMFILATLFSWGSMCQYAFLFYLPVYMLSALLIKILRWKELLAMLMGIAAPYVIVLGFGLVSPQQMQVPQLSNIWQQVADGSIGVELLAVAGTTVTLSVLLLLRNLPSLYSANTATRSMGYAFTLPMVVTAALMVIDYGNVLAYYLTMAFFGACQTGYLIAFGPRRPSPIAYWVVLAIYSGLFLTAAMAGGE